MAILSDDDKKYLEDLFKTFNNEVNLKFFSTKDEKKCEQCGDIKTILDELSALSDKIKIQEYTIEENKEEMEKYEVEYAPALLVMGKEYNRVKYYGVPSGYEFASLIEDMTDIGKGEVLIENEEVKKKVMEIDKPVHLKVFVTPTCPYCPAAVRTAHKFAMLNPNIKADMYESYEFSELADKYQVQGVPRIIINETNHFEGAFPDDKYLEEILKAIQ